MLPDRLKSLLESLENESTLTVKQSELLAELKELSRVLSQPSVAKFLTESRRTATRSTHGVWGGPPGSCDCCGR